MGLDGVELVMAFEEEFGIEIPDRDAEQLVTVGGAYEYVLRKLGVGQKQPRKCATAHAFYRIRRALPLAGRDRRSIKPDTPLSDLFAKNAAERVRAWTVLSLDLCLKLPALVKSRRLTRFMVFVSITFGVAAAVTALVISARHFGVESLAPLAVVSAGTLAITFVLVFLVMELLTEPYRTSLPAATVGDLSRIAVALNMTQFQHEMGDSIRDVEEIWLKLQEIVVQQLGVKREQVYPEARFIEDLGVG